MKAFPQRPDGWNRAGFRLVLGCGLVLVLLFFLLRFFEGAEYAYISGYWGVLEFWKQASRAAALCVGFVLLPWSVAFVLPSSVRKLGAFWYAVAGFCLCGVCLLVWLLGPDPKPR